MNYPKLSALREQIADLRNPHDGCAWTREQDAKSLIPKTIEEVYELEEAIIKNDPQGMQEELGDLLYHVLLYAEMARETQQFDFDDLAEVMLKKHQQRMPSRESRIQMNSEEINSHWEKSKNKSRYAKDLLSGLSPYAPAHSVAYKLQDRASQFGFDWANPRDVIAKIREELGEIEAELDNSPKQALIDECGDLLFAAINLVRQCGGHPESALMGCNQRFRNRIAVMNQFIEAEGRTWESFELAELETLWQKAKLQINS